MVPVSASRHDRADRLLPFARSTRGRPGGGDQADEAGMEAIFDIAHDPTPTLPCAMRKGGSDYTCWIDSTPGTALSTATCASVKGLSTVIAARA
jgi:hypothetical protein